MSLASQALQVVLRHEVNQFCQQIEEGYVSLDSEDGSSYTSESGTDDCPQSGDGRGMSAAQQPLLSSFPGDTPRTPATRLPLRPRQEAEAFSDQSGQQDFQGDGQLFGASHYEFCKEMQGGLLVRDVDCRGVFDHGQHFVLGDPGSHIGKGNEHAYEITGEAGFPGRISSSISFGIAGTW